MSDPARWSMDDVKRHMEQFPGGAKEFARKFNEITPEQALDPRRHLPPEVQEFGKKFEAKGRTQPTRGTMNKTEALYSEILDARKSAGEVIEWDFEPGPLLLAPKQGTIPATRYWRDFRVARKDGRVEAIEVKAGRKSKAGVPHPHFEDGARERLQMAAKKFVEYEWYLAWHYLGTWNIERIG